MWTLLWNYKKALYHHGDSIYIFQSLHVIIPGVVLDVKPKQITVLKNAKNGALLSMAKELNYIYSRRIDGTTNSKRLITGDSVNLPPDKKHVIGTDHNGRII
ncbi:MAG: hypothetical protein H7259_05010 [Cytophagales bacterium]|nr:hypothetical protein [Cytophaga sp.]